MLKAESEFQERELMKMERDRELASLRRQHEREIYMLKRKLHEEKKKASISGNETNFAEHLGILSVSIPSFTLSGIGSSCHVEYMVNVKAVDATWTVMRRFRQFRELHMTMMAAYGATVTSLPFPSRRLFGSRSDQVSGERQRQLNAYLNLLLLTLQKVESAPVYKNPTKEAMLKMSAFFHEDVKEAVEAE